MSIVRSRRAARVPTAVHATEHGLFYGLLKRAGLPLPVTEYRFHATRRWRLDFAWPDARLYLEVDGGTWSNGRHTRGSGWLRDTEKLNAACCHGWRGLRCTPAQLDTLTLIDTIRLALAPPPDPGVLRWQ